MQRYFHRYQDKTWRIVTTLFVLIVGLEVLIEELVPVIASPAHEGVIEGISLIVTLSPALYLLVVRPLVMQIEERKRIQGELEKKLSEIRMLEKIIPICGHCKKIRDKENKWSPIDIYVRKHTNTDFSHGICPDCLSEHYSEFLDELKK